MPTPRKIRETAIQFLYCSDLEGGADPADLFEPFWQCVTESDQRRLLSAVFRSVLHLAQGRPARIEEWSKRQEAAMAHLSVQPETADVASLLERVARSESQWGENLEQLQRLSLDGEDEIIAPRLQTALDGFFRMEKQLAAARTQLLAALCSASGLSRQLEGLVASTKRLQRISERLAMLEHPENFPQQADLAKLRDSKEEIAQLRAGTERYVARIREARATIDAALAEVVENYSPERINPVDRAILRLASSELMNEMIDDKVAINEAVELAKRFGTSDSPRFVNGVLDKVASHLRGKS